MKLILAVAGGGAVGAVGRYLVMMLVTQWAGPGFPWPTFAVNLLGSFVLGALIEASALSWSPSPEVRAFLVIGVLGAFTTFSTFSMDFYVLLTRNLPLQAMGYAVGSVLFCVAGFWAGLMMVRQVTA